MHPVAEAVCVRESETFRITCDGLGFLGCRLVIVGGGYIAYEQVR